MTDGAADLLVNEAYNPDFGVRPLKRHIERTVVADITTQILSGKLRAESRVVVDVSGDQIIVRPQSSMFDSMIVDDQM